MAPMRRLEKGRSMTSVARWGYWFHGLVGLDSMVVTGAHGKSRLLLELFKAGIIPTRIETLLLDADLQRRLVLQQTQCCAIQSAEVGVHVIPADAARVFLTGRPCFCCSFHLPKPVPVRSDWLSPTRADHVKNCFAAGGVEVPPQRLSVDGDDVIRIAGHGADDGDAPLLRGLDASLR